MLGRARRERIGHGEEQNAVWFQQAEGAFESLLDRGNNVLEDFARNDEIVSAEFALPARMNSELGRDRAVLARSGTACF